MQDFQSTLFTRQNRNHQRFARLRKKEVNLFEDKLPMESDMSRER